ncbi:hypothetical protein MHU86_5190 [Fragilaria crotonensis]|nr:hypothetical protein MHU86_5190 [Fragilaria crotonensis]
MKRHLGVDYKFGRDEHGQYIQTTMKDYHESMVQDYEKVMSGSIKTFSTRAAVTRSAINEIILIEEFRSFVGRIMFACGKTEPSNTIKGMQGIDCASDIP